MSKKIEIPVEIHYVEMQYYWKSTATIPFEVEAVTEEEAPVAMLEKMHYFSNDHEPDHGYLWKAWRLWRGKLYTKRFERKNGMLRFSYRSKRYLGDDERFVLYQGSGPIGLTDSKDHPTAPDPSLEHMQSLLEEHMGRLIALGDSLWEEAAEPGYGLWPAGRQAALDIFPGDDWRCTHNANEWAEFYDQMKALKADGKWPGDEYTHRIEVLIPEAVALLSSSERNEIEHLATAANLLDSAADELTAARGDGFAADDADELLSGLKRRLLDILADLAQREQRGYRQLSEEELEQAAIEKMLELGVR